MSSSMHKSILATPGIMTTAISAPPVSPIHWQGPSASYIAVDPAGTMDIVPTGEWSLTEPLVKPLHRFSERELEGLVRELQDTGYEERENAIAEITKQCVMRWRGDRKMGGSFQSQFYGAPFRYEALFRVGNKHLRLVVTLPSWTADKWVKPLVERMIRDQIEEAT